MSSKTDKSISAALYTVPMGTYLDSNYEIPKLQREIAPAQRIAFGKKLIVFLWILMSNALPEEQSDSLKSMGFNKLSDGFFLPFIFGFDANQSRNYILDGRHRNACLVAFRDNLLALPKHIENFEYPDALEWAKKAGILGKKFNDMPEEFKTKFLNAKVLTQVVDFRSQSFGTQIFCAANGGKQVSPIDYIESLHSDNICLDIIKDLYEKSYQYARSPFEIADDSLFTSKEYSAFAFMLKSNKNTFRNRDSFFNYLIRIITLLNYQEEYIASSITMYSNYLDKRKSWSQNKVVKELKDLAKKINQVSGCVENFSLGYFATILTGIVFAINVNTKWQDYVAYQSRRTNVLMSRSKDDSKKISKYFSNKRNWEEIDRLFNEWIHTPVPVVGRNIERPSEIVQKLTDSAKDRNQIELLISFVDLVCSRVAM